MAKKRRDAIRIAENLVSRGKLEAAVKEYEKVLRADASDTSTLNRVGDLYVRLKRLDKATELFRRAAEHFSREGFYVKAIAIFKKIIRLDPTRIDVYETLADLYHRQGLINEARTQYQVVADYFAQGGDSSKVVSIHERMVGLEPDHPTLRVRLAELYCDVGRMSDAMQQYREIATFMMAHEKVEEAVKVYRGALELDPQDLAYLTDAVLHLKDEGYPEAALTLLQHAVGRNPEAARVGALTGLEERRTPSRPAAPPPAKRDDVPVGEISPEPEAVEPAGEDAEPEAEESEVEVTEPVAEETEPAREEVESAAVEEVVDEAEESAAEPPAEAEEKTAAEPAVFLDLEEADEVPYAVSRDLDETGEIVLDLGELEADAEGAGEVEAEAAEVPEADPAVASPETVAAAPRPEPAPVVDPAVARAEELCHEARVLANYGLEDKAVDLLEEALGLVPDHLQAQLLAARVHALVGQEARAAELAESSAGPAEAAGEAPAWTELAEFLSARGFEVDDGRVTAPAPQPKPELESEPEPEPEPAREPEPEPVVESDVEIRVEEVERPEVAEPVEVTPPVEDKRLDWLAEPQSADAGAEELFGEDEEFFDLAGELEEELSREDFLDEEFEPQPAEQSLEEIVEGFRKGVAETLAAEDYDTHYNLGIAYREMGLVDEAIGEFQLAAKDGRYLVDCCSLLGACFLEKGFPDLAVKWHERGLASPNISEKETLGLLYELGNLYAATGENEAAYDTFTEIYGTNSNYRDVVARLAELSGGE